MNLDDVIAARKAYDKAFQSAKKKLRQEIAEYLRHLIPSELILEWDQDGNEVCSPTVFPEKIRIDRHDGLPVSSARGEKDTEWAPGDPFDGYRLSDGVSKYRNNVDGLTRAALGKLIKGWQELPSDVLIRVFGNATIRVTPKGKITVLR